MSRKDKLKKYFQKSDVWTTVFLVVAILAVFNFLSYQIFVRWDVTENDIHSLSSVSKKTVRNLEDVVNIKVYFSKNLPNRYINIRQRVSDILDEYKAYSDGNVRVEFIHPEEKWEEPRTKLRAMGIPEVQFNVMDQGSYEVSRGYMGMSIQYGTDQESIPVVSEEDDLEYRITTSIKKAIQEKLTRVGILTGEGLLEGGKEMRTVSEKLGELYEVAEVNIDGSEGVPSRVSTLIVPGPTREFSEEKLRALDEYLMEGGNIFFLVDGVTVDVERGLLATPNETNLNDLLEKYGVRVKNNLVLDENAGQVSFSSGFMAFTKEYPLWPEVTKENFNPEEPAVADMERLVLPWVSGIETLEEKPNDVDISYLARTSENSWTQEKPFRLAPNIDFQPSAQTESKEVAVKVSGAITSAYDNGRTEQGEIVLVGDSDLIKDRFLERTGRGDGSESSIFFQNVVGDLSLEDNLIGMRSKKIADRSLIELSGDERQLIKYANILALPIVVVIVGMLRYYLRRKSVGLKDILKRGKSEFSNE
jgi:gliding-associated putative ABC transporter substrate-binding component GldG